MGKGRRWWLGSKTTVALYIYTILRFWTQSISIQSRVKPIDVGNWPPSKSPNFISLSLVYRGSQYPTSLSEAGSCSTFSYPGWSLALIEAVGNRFLILAILIKMTGHKVPRTNVPLDNPRGDQADAHCHAPGCARSPAESRNLQKIFVVKRYGRPRTENKFLI